MYRDMFALFRRYAGDVSSVTLWGLADDNTWLDTFPVTRKDAPLLFDVGPQAKPAYWAVVEPGRITPTGSPSASPSSSPSGGSGPGCAVSYRVTGSWPGGFQGEVTLTNSGTAALTHWSLAWSYADGQRITQAWRRLRSAGQLIHLIAPLKTLVQLKTAMLSQPSPEPEMFAGFHPLPAGEAVQVGSQ